MMPSTIEMESFALTLHCHRGEGFPAMDGDTVDPYVRMQLPTLGLIKTKYIPGVPVNEDGAFALFDEKLVAPLALPKGDRKPSTLVHVSVVDMNKASSDEIIGTTCIDLTQDGKRYESPTWINLYGTPHSRRDVKLETQRDLVELMNAGKVPGTHFRGRLLITLSEARMINTTWGRCIFAP